MLCGPMMDNGGKEGFFAEWWIKFRLCLESMENERK